MRAVKFGVGLVGLVGALTIVPGGETWPPSLGWAQDARKRAEDLAKGATERFDELVGGKGKNGQSGTASGSKLSDSLAEQIYAWVSGSGRHYQDLVRRMVEPPQLNPVEDAARRVAAEQRRTGVAGADVPRPMVVADAGLIEQGVGWVHRSSRDYQEMMRRLSVPAEPSGVIGARKPATDKAAEDARKAEEAKQAEDAHKAAEAKKAADAKKAEDDARRVAEAKKAEDARKAAEAKKAADAKKAEDDARRVAEAKKAEETKQAEEVRGAAEARKAADAKKAEDDARRVAEAKKAEEAKQAAARQATKAQRAASNSKVAVARKAPKAHSTRKTRKAKIAEAKRKKQARKAAAERRKYAWREPRRTGRRSKAQRARDCRLAGTDVALPGWYVVKKGDTLWKIASRHYHKGRLYRLIYEANAGRIDHPTRIYPCQRLYIPKVRWRRR